MRVVYGGRMELKHDLWHLAFANLIEKQAPPGFEVQSEVRLTIEPQRADILLLRRQGIERADDRAGVLRWLWPRLERVTIVELKSPNRSSFRPGDLLRLCGYGFVYHAANIKDLSATRELTLVLVLPSLTPTLLDEVSLLGWRFESVGAGYGRIVGPVYALYVAVTDEVSEEEHDEFLRLFSHRRPVPGLATLWFRDWLAERKMKEPEIVNTPDYEEIFQKLIEAWPPEKRLAGLAPEQRLAGLAPEQRLAGLAPEQLLAGLAPEQRLAGLAPEQALLAAVEVLRNLSPEHVRSLPDDLRHEIERRLGLARSERS